MTSAQASSPRVIGASPRAAWLVGAIAVVVGLATSVYLTVEHYSTKKSFACPENATINCLKVTTSKWSVIAGVPVAVLGLAFFVVMTVLVLVPRQDAPLRLLRLVGASAGILMVIYLVYVELFEVDAICLYCTLVHACTLVLFGATLWRDALTPVPAA